MASRVLHPDWRPVIGLTIAFALLDVMVLLLLLAATSKSPGDIAGTVPVGGWTLFAVILALEPSWIVPLLAWHTAKDIAARKRGPGERRVSIFATRIQPA
ncbi:MAG TPA: hypothetical protein VI893_03505 [Thermoplasmata archaeon]|nr:hypothetical protein [Thermoplasmata archaeon]